MKKKEEPLIRVKVVYAGRADSEEKLRNAYRLLAKIAIRNYQRKVGTWSQQSMFV